MNTPTKQRNFVLPTGRDLAKRIGTLDWMRVSHELDTSGCAVIPHLVAPDDCHAIAALYPDDSIFRSHIYLHRHGFGHGEYKYFRYPLPDLIEDMRATFYHHLAPIANRWHEQMRLLTRFPARHDEFIVRCHAARQESPTPLLVQYVAEDYNCMHQDLYGEHVFPLQVVILLAKPGLDFSGGEFVLTEQRPRMQSRAEVVPMAQGDALIFTVQHRPVVGTRGSHRVNIRHGVSRIRSGLRHTLGIIFHDAA
ncbi:MAG: 2OG-Fe(II) oxygenase [Acidithiobacillus ferrivorans]|nr:2OG-Fe(II) oxygenase [Acidithiobacillus ferrivorans]